EELLPQVELADGDAVFLTDVGDRGLLDEVFAEQGDLLLGSEVAALPGHGGSSEGVLPLTPSKANSCFGWGKTVDHRHRRCPSGEPEESDRRLARRTGAPK